MDVHQQASMILLGMEQQSACSAEEFFLQDSTGLIAVHLSMDIYECLTGESSWCEMMWTYQNNSPWETPFSSLCTAINQR